MNMIIDISNWFWYSHSRTTTEWSFWTNVIARRISYRVEESRRRRARWSSSCRGLCPRPESSMLLPLELLVIPNYSASILWTNGYIWEPRNMAYMTRIGLWGVGQSFQDFNAFIDAVERRGVGAMEIVAMDMKVGEFVFYWPKMLVRVFLYKKLRDLMRIFLWDLYSWIRHIWKVWSSLN